jgi:hypothetical protein
MDAKHRKGLLRTERSAGALRKGLFHVIPNRLQGFMQSITWISS